MVQDKPLRTSWQRKMKDRQERKLAKDFARHLEEEKERIVGGTGPGQRQSQPPAIPAGPVGPMETRPRPAPAQSPCTCSLAVVRSPWNE